MIPQLLLEEILLGEKKAEKYYDKYGKEELEKALSELRKSNEEIQGTLPAGLAKEKFMKKVGRENGSAFQQTEVPEVNFPVSQKTAGKNFTSVKYLRYVTFAAAAALALAFSLPLLMNYNKANSAESVKESATRIKGKALPHQELRLYKKDGNSAVSLKNGTSAKENDVIQITYLAGEYDYGVIFSVDGNGNVTRHFPEEGWVSEKLLKTGAEVPLEFSYELDDAPKYECFIFVASKDSFDLSKIEEIEKSDYNLSFLKKGSYLPEGCDGSIFVLKK